MQPSVENLFKPITRDATINDVEDIYELMECYASDGILLPRTKTDIVDNLMKFSVIEIQGKTVACAALEIFNKNLCEVRSLVVASEMKHFGYGRILVKVLIDKALSMGLTRIMALTYVPGFFHRIGFHTVNKEIFPEKVWGVCAKCSRFNDCDEIAVLKELK
jgi:amino-acid N-acetyltransferase